MSSVDEVIKLSKESDAVIDRRFNLIAKIMFLIFVFILGCELLLLFGRFVYLVFSKGIVF